MRRAARALRARREGRVTRVHDGVRLRLLRASRAAMQSDGCRPELLSANAPPDRAGVLRSEVPSRRHVRSPALQARVPGRTVRERALTSVLPGGDPEVARLDVKSVD